MSGALLTRHMALVSFSIACEVGAGAAHDALACVRQPPPLPLLGLVGGLRIELVVR